MLRPQRPRRPDPVALATPIKQPPDAAAIIPPNATVQMTTPTPKPRPVIPRDPDGTEYHSRFHEKPEPHHKSVLMVYDGMRLVKDFEVIGPSLFGNYRRLKVLLEEWRAAQEKTPPNG